MVGVEAAALSAAVTGTLKIVGNKLAPLVIKEYSSIVGVKKDLGELKELAEEINCWLENGEEGRGAMEGVKSLNWLKKLKDIANTVDDVVDELQLETEKLDMNGDGGIVSKHLIKKTNSFRVQCKAAHKIKAVKKRFAVIVKQRTDLTAIVGHNSIRHLNKAIVDMPTLPVINEAAVLGRGQDKKNIITKLLKANVQQELEVVSIIGLGGAGKTTLAKLVFNDCKIIKKHFEVRLWVHVSQEFNIKKLVEKLFEAVTKGKSDHHSLPYMSETISNELTRKNFLLVLDDVWIDSRSQHEQFQEEFMVHLKSGKSRSKILVTTRNRRVAEVMESTELYDLPFLSLDDSWKLFNRSFGPGLKELGYEYQQIGKEIVGKCGGVPLAIKVLAGTLRDKKLVGEWEAMRDNNLLDAEGEKSVSACLKLSYFCLPSHLKQCFTMCSLFPKGHAIYKEQLIDLWIAHNMISLTIGVDYLEDIGDRYFNSLVQVSFLHDVDKYDGRLRCKMHDLVHNLARSISCEEISIGVPRSMKGYRYFCLTNIQQPRESLPKKVFHKARAIYVDKGNDIIFHETLKNAKHLRSVIVNHISSMAMLISIFQVKNLKYLEMTRLQCEVLPEAISDIWSLEAVHLRYSGLIELHKSIGKLQKLRTLNLSSCWKLKCLPDSIGDCNSLSSIDLFSCRELTALPNSIGKLKKLRMLNLSQCAKLMCLPDSIGDCNMLSRIGLLNCGRLIALPNSIAKLQKIKYLDLSHCAKLKCLPDSFGDSSMLSSINLFDCEELTSLPNSIGMLQKLETLNLSQCAKLKCLPDSIGDCNMLLSLDLRKCEEITDLPNSIGRNEKLRVLGLGYTKLEKMPSSININTLRNLECLDLCNCWELAELPKGISNLHKLQILNLKSCTRLVELPEGISNLQKLQVLNLKYCSKLGGMPIGIGQLSQLQNLGLFVVGEGERFARISQLANVSTIGEELIIIGIEHVMEPDDAHKACLKLKSNLQRLNLEWKRCHVGEMNTELEQAVLDGLEPPPRIKKLEIRGYSGRQYACWMQNQVDVGVQRLAHFPLLRVMRLYDFPNLKHLHGLVELPFLEKLQLERMPSLESISRGPFPSLVKLIMDCLPSLGDVCMVAQRAISDADEGGCCSNCTPHLGQVRVGNCVTYLIIIDCPKLKVKPYLPLSLQYLRLSRSSEQLMQSPDQCEGCSLSSGFSHLKKLDLWGMTGSLGSAHGWELLKHMTALETLDIRFSEALTNLPDCLGSLTSLQSLSVSNCSAIQMMPECLGELRSLHELSINSCEKLSSLPESMGQLASLQELHIGWCNSLQQLPECLGELCSLRILYIGDLPSINKIPQSLQHLTSLQDLTIVRCNALHELPRCLGELRSLLKFNIGCLPGLTCLPESMCGLTSLQTLYITNCPGIKSLPEGIKGLSSLKRLEISGCPGIKSLPEGLRFSPAEAEHACDCGGVDV